MPTFLWILLALLAVMVTIGYFERKKLAQAAKQEAADLKKSAEHVAGHVVEDVGQFIEKKGEKLDAFGHKVEQRGKNLQ